jgi:hypothetical protein
MQPLTLFAVKFIYYVEKAVFVAGPNFHVCVAARAEGERVECGRGSE